VVDSHLLQDKISGRVAVLVRDLARFRKYSGNKADNKTRTNNNRRFIFHNKGIDMVNLPSLLHNKNVIATIPACIDNTPLIPTRTQLLIKYSTTRKLYPR
jgi:hypothetical protein